MRNKKATKRKTSQLVLVRHGESVWNALGLWCGWIDVPLSKKGKEEARLAASYIKNIKFDIAFTSDLKRAYQTLDIIKKELDILSLPTIVEPAFKERHYGIYAGKSKWEIKKKIGEEAFKKLRRGWNVPIPRGETLKDVYQRVLAKFEMHIKPAIYKGLNILFVAHGNSNRALMKHLEQIPDERISEVEIATGEVLIYKMDASGKVVGREKRVVNKDRGKQ